MNFSIIVSLFCIIMVFSLIAYAAAMIYYIVFGGL